MAILVQFDFPSTGPWGADMSAAYAELADSIAAVPGLHWKLWTENKDTQMAGGIYLFDDEASARAYTELHTSRLQSFGVTDIRALFFDVNDELSRTTRGPLS